MAYVQHTKCIAPSSWSGLAPGLIATAIGAAIALLAGAVFAALAIGAIVALVQYCHWWLYGRLVCLGGDRCAVGLLVATHPPSGKSGFDAFDTDYSIDLLLAPSRPDQSDAEILAGFQGELIRHQAAIGGIGLATPGEFAEAPTLLPVGAPSTLRRVPVLHAEFEGGGVWQLYNFALAALAVVVVGAVLCAIPIIGWIACLIAAIVALVLVAVGVAVALNDTGAPTDVNADLDHLHSLQDVLIVHGTWVYDSAHEGWNEIHPIKHAQRIADVANPLTGWPKDIEERVKKWCGAVDAAIDAGGQGLTARPENQWEVHPEVDGCAPAPEVPR
jgi:hypothetical protein